MRTKIPQGVLYDLGVDLAQDMMDMTDEEFHDYIIKKKYKDGRLSEEETFIELI